MNSTTYSTELLKTNISGTQVPYNKKTEENWKDNKP
jgi:hypothetical protein